MTFQPQFFLLGFLLIFVTGCQPRQAVTLALLGDLVLGRGVHPQPASLAYLVPALSTVDLLLANLESPLAPVPPTQDSTINLCASSLQVALLPAWGIDLLSLANNHNLDCGPDGLKETRAALESASIIPVGPAMDPVLLEMNGLQLTFLAFNDISSRLDENAALQAIRSATATGALVIVSIHWGVEYQGGASHRQKSLAKEFADAGAALIWGHHPHVLQPAAWVGAHPCEGSKPSQGCTLVLYSLGNALFDQGGLADTRRSAMVLVTLDPDGVKSARAVPFEIDVVNSRTIQPDSGTAEKIRDRLNLP